MPEEGNQSSNNPDPQTSKSPKPEAQPPSKPIQRPVPMEGDLATKADRGPRETRDGSD